MDFQTFQDETRKTLISKKEAQLLWYHALGLGGEAGEFLDKVKKLYRDTETQELHDEQKKALAGELGDILWYMARLSDILGYSMNDIAQMQIDKGIYRQRQGKIHGSGDNR